MRWLITQYLHSVKLTVNTVKQIDTQLVFAFNSFVIAETVITAGPHEERLIEAIFSNYSRLSRPVADESDALEIKFGLSLQQIISVVKERIVKIHCSVLWGLA